jgi:hypothetical protein
MKEKMKAVIVIGTGDEAREMEFTVNEPTLGDRRELAAYQLTHYIAPPEESGAALKALVERAYELLGVDESQMSGVSIYEQVTLGQRLASWAVEKDSKNS